MALGAPFRIKLINAQMPAMDGFALVEQMQRSPELSGSIIMILGPGARPSDFARCEQLGVSACLSKPVKQSELIHALARAVKNLPADPPGPHLSVAPSPGGLVLFGSF